MSTPVAFDTTLLVPAASAGSQPSGPRSPWSPVRQAPRSIASHIVELAEMEGGQSAIILTQIITQTVNDCINVSGRKIATRNKQNITFKHEQLKHTHSTTV